MVGEQLSAVDEVRACHGWGGSTMPPARTINVFKRGCHAIAAAGMHWKMESGLLDLKEKAILLIIFNEARHLGQAVSSDE